MRHYLVLPDLGMDPIPVAASIWLVPRGSKVAEGDRVLEVVAGSVSVDLPSPTTGILSEKLVEEDQVLTSGQKLAVILEDA